MRWRSRSWARSRARSRALASFAGAAFVAALGACNALLDNEVRTLRPAASGLEGGADARPTCDGGPCVPFLFYSQPNVSKIVVAGDRVYFVHTDKAPHWCDVAGCERGEGDIGTAQARDLAVELSVGGGTIFLAEQSAVVSYPIGSPKPTTLASIQKVLSITADGAAVYFGSSLGEIFACDRASLCTGQTPQKIASSGGNVTSIAVDDTRVYWTTSLTTGMHEAAKKARDAGPSTSLLEGTSSSAAVFEGQVYFATAGASDNGRIVRGGLTTSPRDVLVSGVGAVQGFAVENGGATVYFTEKTSGGSVLECRGRCTGSSATVIAAKQNASSIVATPSALYWNDPATGVFKLAK